MSSILVTNTPVSCLHADIYNLELFQTYKEYQRQFYLQVSRNLFKTEIIISYKIFTTCLGYSKPIYLRFIYIITSFWGVVLQALVHNFILK